MMARWLSRACLTGCSIVGVLGAVELALRWQAGREAPRAVTERIDPILGPVKAAGKGIVYRKRDAFNVYDTNADGFYDRERTKAKPPGTFRIAVIGDSFIDAVQVPFESTLAQRLERALDRDGRRVEVLNFARGGTSLAEYLLLLEHWALTYDPDLVLIFIYNENDLDDLRPGTIPTEDGLYVRPVYAIEGGELVLQPYRPLALARPRARRPSLRLVEVLRERVWDHPRLLASLMRLGVMDSSQLYSRGALVDEHGYPALYGVYAATRAPDWDGASMLAERLLMEMRRRCDARGVRLAAVSIPSQFEVHEGMRARLFATYPAMRSMAWAFDRVSRELEAAARRAGIPFLRLDEPLQRYAAAHPGTPLYFPFNAHWNVRGNEVAADAVKRFLDPWRP